MRPGLFVALFTALLTILAVIVPLPVAPPALAGGPQPLASAAPRCLRFSYESGFHDPSLPTVVRLRNDRRWNNGWYVAELEPSPSGAEGAGFWRTAGPDSLDLTVHHGPRLIRVAARGPHAAGRVTSWRATPLLGFLGLRDYEVRAADIVCP